MAEFGSLTSKSFMCVNTERANSDRLENCINFPYSRQCSHVLLFGIIGPRLSWEWTENRLYVTLFNLKTLLASCRPVTCHMSPDEILLYFWYFIRQNNADPI